MIGNVEAHIMSVISYNKIWRIYYGAYKKKKKNTLEYFTS